MKLGLIFLMTSIFMLFISACNKDHLGDDEIQREEEIRSEDFRERDNYNRALPSDSNGIEIERDKFNIGPNKPSVRD